MQRPRVGEGRRARAAKMVEDEEEGRKKSSDGLVGWACVCVSSVAVLMMGGVVFGFSSLYEVLYRERVYASECADRDSCSRTEGCCGEQRLQLTMVASSSLFCADAVMVAYGELNDRLGPRSCLVVGVCLSVIGFDLMALNAADEVWFAALVLLGLAGPGVFMGCMGYGSALPDWEPTLTAACAAMWDTSSVIFLLFALATRHVTVTAAAAAWSAACLLVGFAAVGLSARVHATRSPPQHQAIGPYLRRRDTVLLVLFMSVYNLNSAFYIETVSDQMRASFAETSARRLDLTFDLAFPIGGLLTSVVAAKLLQRQDLSHASLFSVVFALAALFSVAQLPPLLPCQYLAALLFGPARTLQWALYFHLLVVRYPDAVSGRLIGYGNLAIALVGDGLPYGLAAFVDDLALGSKALKYLLVHATLTLLIILTGFLFLGHLLHQHRLQRQLPRDHRPGPDDDDDAAAALYAPILVEAEPDALPPPALPDALAAAGLVAAAGDRGREESKEVDPPPSGSHVVEVDAAAAAQ